VLYAVAQSGGMYASNAPGLIRSDNGGDSWQTRALPLDLYESVQSMATSSDGSKVFILTSGGSNNMYGSARLWKSTNRGSNWSELNLGDIQIASPPSFSVSGDAEKIVVKSSLPEVADMGTMVMTNWAPAFSVSTNGGSTWTTRPQPDLYPAPYNPSPGMSNTASVDYVLSKLGNVLIYRKWGPANYMHAYQSVELATSSDMGSTWKAANLPISTSAAPAVATDATGMQIAVANWQTSINNTNATDGILLTAARTVVISGDGAAELVHRGEGKWTLLWGNSGYAASYFAPQPVDTE
jgi:hypothetical protein